MTFLGAPEVLQIIREPLTDPAAGEVRVRIEAFAVNPVDAMMRSGRLPTPGSPTRSRIGVEGTGVIDAVGPGVTALQVGDPVIITAIPDAVAHGSCAEHTTLPATALLPRPAGLDVTQAAGIWVGFSTAYGALVETAGMRAGDRVLIAGASGSVGRAAL